MQALIGDSTDNVPGVPGIGVKTAAQLIGEYGDLETLLKRAGEIKQDKRRQSLIDNAESARMSKKLVTLDENVPLDVPVDQLAVHEPDYKNLIAFLKAMEFKTLTRRVAEKSGIDAARRGCEAGRRRRRARRATVRPRQAAGTCFAPAPLPVKPGGSEPSERRRSRRSRSPPRAPRTPRRQDRPLANTNACARSTACKQWIARAHDLGVVAVDTETTSLDPMQAHLCGFSLAVAPNEACYVPLGHREGGGGGSDLFAPEPSSAPDQIAGGRGARRAQAAAGRHERPQGRRRT